MELYSILIIGCFISSMLVITQTALPSELYWNSMLPNVAMPFAIKELLTPDFNKYKDAHKDSYSRKVRFDEDGLLFKLTNFYQYQPQLDVANINMNTTLFFLPKDMVPRNQMSLEFHNNKANRPPLLPRNVAQSIPFSLQELPEVLSHFSVEPESIEAKMIKVVITTCELPGMIGEKKFCATSLESMIDFTLSNLGRKVQVVTTQLHKREVKAKEYTIMDGVKKMGADKSVVCHKLDYPYAVFLCHAVPKTSVFEVPLEDDEGFGSKIVALCHKDTSAWDPNHVAFKVLKVKPGKTSTICHFLPDDNVVWVQV